MVLSAAPKALLIRDKRELPYERLWISGAKPVVRRCIDAGYTPFQQALHQLMIAGFWSMLGPLREANMRLEGMFQAEKKEEGLLWGSWSDFVDPEKET